MPRIVVNSKNKKICLFLFLYIRYIYYIYINMDKNDIITQCIHCFEILKNLPMSDQIETINQIKNILHSYSPFKNEPTDCIIWKKLDKIQSNNYNPNSVAPPEMKLLAHSIQHDGYTQPIVVMKEENKDQYIVIDGHHRIRIAKENEFISKRLHGYAPVTIINENNTNIKDRMASTIRHNRARGKHGVQPMREIIKELYVKGWDDNRIAKELGMENDEVLRFKQFCGLPELFKDHEYSKSWN